VEAFWWFSGGLVVVYWCFRGGLMVVCADTENPTLTENFICGASAGAIAMTLVYPMYVVQNRYNHVLSSPPFPHQTLSHLS